MSRPSNWIAVLLAGVAAAAMPSCDGWGDSECSEEGAVALYEERIAPILADDRPKSCNQCHLSGVDLDMFVKATPCQTMACLIDRGLVNLDSPDDSTILTWIKRASPKSVGITSHVIDEEYEGFRQWIEHTASCGIDSCPTFEDPCETGQKEKECALDAEDPQLLDDPGGCDDLVIEELFQADVYAFRGRCAPCHWSTTKDVPEAPKWITIGQCDTASLATLREVERRGLIDTQHPLESLLFLKPLAVDLGGVEHGGGDKFHDPAESAYQGFVHFLERYAECH